MLRCEKDVFLKNKFFWNPHFPQQYTQIQSYDGDKWQVKYDLSTLFKMTRKPLENILICKKTLLHKRFTWHKPRARS